ncbi:MAG TPA: hypothetical protein VEL11_17485 [Candidatus Bathyarchaeia archaeon]|nr:hypothetical protein [Candidatus Bathyarchaeia archaeon]
MPVKIKSYISCPVVGLTTIILVLLTSAMLTSLVYAQIFTFPNTHSNTISTTTGTHSRLSELQEQQTSQRNLHLVKITSPIKGQEVAVGKELEIFGISADNATTSGCGVSIKVNGINPYQNVPKASPGGHREYSKWNFALTPAYTLIKAGQNRITAKFSCINKPNLISYHSVNVTGISSAAIHPVTSNTIHPVTSNVDTKHNKVFSISLHLAGNSLHPGDKQIITIIVLDKNSGSAVTGASVLGKISNPSGQFKNVKGTTDDAGKASYSWVISNGDPIGKYKITTDVSASSYEKYSTSKIFKVTPIANTIPSPYNIDSNPDPINSNNVNSPPIIPSNPYTANSNNDHRNHHNHSPPIITSTPYNAYDNNPPPIITSTPYNAYDNNPPPATSSPLTIPSENNPTPATSSPTITSNPDNTNDNNPTPATSSPTITSNPDNKIPFLLPFH